MTIILIIMGLFLFVGAIYNNLNSSGVLVSQSYTNASCAAQAEQTGIPSCAGTGATGCEITVSNCQMNSVSFMNPNSPFTYLFQGDILGFLGFVAAPANTQSLMSTYLIMLDNCTDITGGSNTGETISSFYCTGGTFNSATTPGFPPYNATSSTGNNSNWNILSLTPNAADTGPIVPVQYVPSLIYGLYLANGSTFQNTYCDAIGICYTLPSITCGTSTNTHYAEQYCLFVVIQHSANFGNVASFLAFLGGAVLLVFSLGITIAAQVLSTGFTFGVSDQGARMFGAMGIGIMSWDFIQSEFAGWVLALNGLLTGLGTAILGACTILFFFGIIWFAYTYE